MTLSRSISTGVFRCCQIVGARMLGARRGSIVNLASVHSRIASPGRAAYCATKTGLVGLTRALAVEWASRGVRVNAVAPGYMNTRLTMDAIESGLISESELLDRIPLGRLGSPSMSHDRSCSSPPRSRSTSRARRSRSTAATRHSARPAPRAGSSAGRTMTERMPLTGNRGGCSRALCCRPAVHAHPRRPRRDGHQGRAARRRRFRGADAAERRSRETNLGWLGSSRRRTGSSRNSGR